LILGYSKEFLMMQRKLYYVIKGDVQMKNFAKIILAVLVVCTAVVGFASAVAIYKTKFNKKYITVCE